MRDEPCFSHPRSGWLRIPRVLAVSLAYFFLCALLAAVLAYPCYRVTHGAIGIRAVVSRGSLLLAIMGVWPLCRLLHLNWADLGFAPSGMDWRKGLIKGWIWGVVMLGLHSLVLVLLDIRGLDQMAVTGVGHLVRNLAQALGIGLLVAIIEETLFRGVMFAALKQSSGAIAAVILSAFYYAALHFFRADPAIDLSDPGWSSGFSILLNALAHLLTAPVDSGLALFCAGLFLALVRLYLPWGLIYGVGLHAGWVFVIKFSKTLTHAVPGGDWAFLVGRYDGFTGYLAAGWMGMLSLMLGLWFYHRHNTTQRPRI